VKPHLHAPLVLALAIPALSCAPNPPPSPAHAPEPAPAHDASSSTEPPSSAPARGEGELDAAFTALGARFLDTLLAMSPELATERGDHRFDGRWSDVSAAGDDALRKFIAETKAELEKFPPANLGAEAKVDRAILENQLDAWTFGLDVLARAENDPLLLTSLLSDGLDPLIVRDFAPIEERMKSLEGRLQGLPDVVRAGKARLKRPPRVFTETAIEQTKGLVALVKTGLTESIAKVPAQKASLEAARAGAERALIELEAFLTKELLPRSDGDFRLGKDRFEKKLRFTLADPTLGADDLAKAARELLDESKEGMVQTARELWPTLMPGKPLPKAGTDVEKSALVKTVLARLAEDRPTNATIVADAAKILGDLTRFVQSEDIVRVPDEPCRVIEMPEYRRGVTIAYCEASGPLEKKQETYYAIAPTPKDWPKARAESFYKEYASMLVNLSVHEAMPGHYLQAMHANRFASSVRAVFDDGAFVEGWAVYGESVMAAHGYGGPKVRMMRQKMAARVAANAILDHGIHAGGMTEAEALRLMMQGAFQEEGEAVAKWKRARLTSTQLSTYFYGFREMRRFRAEAEKKKGFQERTYHDALLAHGAPPMRELHGLLFKEAHAGD
jgi:uncharacterized protein (DUF885 family)